MVESEGDGWVGSDVRGRGSNRGGKEGGGVMEERRRERDGGEKEGEGWRREEIGRAHV